MNFTKGPWYTDDSEFPSVGTVIDAEGEQICQTSERKEYASDRAKQVEIRNTNARLIAASPDLLEALKYAKRFLKSGDVDMAFIELAIAKAEGTV